MKYIKGLSLIILVFASYAHGSKWPWEWDLDCPYHATVAVNQDLIERTPAEVEAWVKNETSSVRARLSQKRPDINALVKKFADSLVQNAGWRCKALKQGFCAGVDKLPAGYKAHATWETKNALRRFGCITHDEL